MVMQLRLTSIFSCSVKKGCSVSAEVSFSRCSRDRQIPLKISLTGELPKSVVLVTVPLFFLSMTCSTLQHYISTENRDKCASTHTFHSSPSSFASTGVASPFETGSFGFSTSFFS